MSKLLVQRTGAVQENSLFYRVGANLKKKKKKTLEEKKNLRARTTEPTHSTGLLRNEKSHLSEKPGTPTTE